MRIKKYIPLGMPKSLLSISLSLLLAVTSVYAVPAGDQTAGEVKALIPSASRNAQPVKAKDTIAWNDLLKTDAGGRLRAGLTAGSILSLGSNSELKVVQHDAVSQQTLITMNYGKLRNQVVKITQPDGKYEVKTPNAVVGVTGTDFYVSHENNLTTVICYKGSVEVTPESGAKVVKKDEKSKRKGAFIILLAGQMVVIGGDTPPEGYLATATPAALALASMEDTNIPEQRRLAGAPPIHRLRNILIGVGTAAGLGLGVGLGVSGTGSSSKSTPPPPPAPTIIDFTNQFGTVLATSDGIMTKGSELQNYNGIAAPANKSLGRVSFSAGAFAGSDILTGGTFSSAGSSFAVTSGPANYGQPPKGPIFTGSFTGPVTWTLVSKTGYTDNFTLSSAFSGTFYTGATVTGTTTQNITLYTNQWAVDHEALIRIGKGQFSIPAAAAKGLAGAQLGLAGARIGSPDARLNALARKSMRHKSFGWTFRF